MDKKLEATARLIEVMDRLRVECPWDREQTIHSLRNNTIEETFEVAQSLIVIVGSPFIFQISSLFIGNLGYFIFQNPGRLQLLKSLVVIRPTNAIVFRLLENCCISVEYFLFGHFP